MWLVDHHERNRSLSCYERHDDDWIMKRHAAKNHFEALGRNDWLLEASRQTFFDGEGPSRGPSGYCFTHQFCHLRKSHDILPDSHHLSLLRGYARGRLVWNSLDSQYDGLASLVLSGWCSKPPSSPDPVVQTVMHPRKFDPRLRTGQFQSHD